MTSTVSSTREEGKYHQQLVILELGLKFESVETAPADSH